MTAPVPRLRMFAGPNGSGKSTIKDMLPSQWLGVYVNADEMEKTIRSTGYLDFAEFEVLAEASEVQAFLQASTLLAKAGYLKMGSPRAYVQNTVMDERILVAVQSDDVVVIFADLPGRADVRRFRSASISGVRRLVVGGCAGIRKKASKSLKAFRKFVRFSDVAGVIRLIRVTMLTVSLALVSAVVRSMSRPTITP